MKNLLKRSIAILDSWVLQLTRFHWAFSIIYYTVFNPRFRRELHAVAAGRAAYAGAGLGAPLTLLRRNIHRVEKGLTMRPRAALFAEEYILETVRAFEKALQISADDPVTIRWAHDVLTAYFCAVEAGPSIADAKRLFDELSANSTNWPAVDGNAWSPKPRAKGVISGVTFDDFFRLCEQRRSTRWFLQRLVPKSIVENAISAALQAPSACNRQPFFFRAFLDPKTAAEISSIAMGTAGYFHQIPALIVVIGDLGCFPHERDRHVPYIDASLATMQLMLALETMGLASCPINWPDIETLEQRMMRRLELKPYQRPIMLLAVGYPDPSGDIAYSAKKTVPQVTQVVPGEHSVEK